MAPHRTAPHRTAPELEPSPAKKRTKRTSREATLPADLPVEETILIPDEVREQPGNYRQVSEEITTKLDYHPARFIKLVTRRPKFVKRLASLDDPQADSFFIAPLPPSLKERSLLTPRLAALPPKSPPTATAIINLTTGRNSTSSCATPSTSRATP